MALSEVFLTTLSVSGFAFLGAVLGVIYKSKCVKIKCCCVEIDRDVAGEEALDRVELGRGEPDIDRPVP